MTYRNLVDAAVETVCEDAKSGDIADYVERSGYLLATFCTQCHGADTRYRAAHGMEPIPLTEKANVDLDDTFPLHAVFAPAAVYYLGAMLVADENERLSEELFDLYADALATIGKDLPTKSGSIRNVYGDVI